jgi:hypothetical protein
MEHTHHSAGKASTTPKDFFLWLGAIAALYGSVTAFFTLIFSYINAAFPDPLAYSGDLYGSGVRAAMATVIVLVPIMLALLLTIRRDIVRTPGKANIWVRRWALVLTIFLASATAAVTLITLITTFLGGELSMRFALKALTVLLIAILAGLHFLADLRGYWTVHREKVNLVGAAVGALALITVAAGFFIIGTPREMRSLRTDQERVDDLRNIQYNVFSYWQTKRELPASLADLNDPLFGVVVDTDPITNQPYEYRAEGDTSFTLCATFDLPSRDTRGMGEYPRMMGYSEAFPGSNDESFEHQAGRTCFTRTIDPERYPPVPETRTI